MAKHDDTNEEVEDLEKTRVPQSLEDLIEKQRTRMLTAFTLLGCTKVGKRWRNHIAAAGSARRTTYCAGGVDVSGV